MFVSRYFVLGLLGKGVVVGTTTKLPKGRLLRPSFDHPSSVFLIFGVRYRPGGARIFFLHHGAALVDAYGGRSHIQEFGCTPMCTKGYIINVPGRRVHRRLQRPIAHPRIRMYINVMDVACVPKATPSCIMALCSQMPKEDSSTSNNSDVHQCDGAQLHVHQRL
jgi:hypothetical protein